VNWIHVALDWNSGNLLLTRNEISKSIKGRQVLGQMNNHHRLKKRLAQWSWIIRYEKKDSPVYKYLILK
jgi:hypothetical protein